MLYLVLAFIAGMIVMDTLWAWRTGVLSMLIRRITRR